MSIPDISKSFSISVDYKDRKAQPNWESLLIADVIFIDKTHPTAQPILYFLKDNILSIHEDTVELKNPHSLSHESFIHMGEVISIDKKKKMILLTNKNRVSYNYMIVATGTKPVVSFQDEEFSAGLQALMDALRVKQKIPSSFSTQTSSSDNQSASMTSKSQASQEEASTDDIDKIVHPYITAAMSKAIASELYAIKQRLYEVQL